MERGKVMKEKVESREMRFGKGWIEVRWEQPIPCQDIPQDQRISCTCGKR